MCVINRNEEVNYFSTTLKSTHFFLASIIYICQSEPNNLFIGILAMNLLQKRKKFYDDYHL